MKSILFVDDDKDVLEALARNLFFHKEKWNLYFARTATKAFEILETNKIDLIVADIAMSEMNGIEMLKKIRANEKFSDLKVIVFTGMKQKTLAPVLAPFNIEEFITKPYPVEMLIEDLEEILGD